MERKSKKTKNIEQKLLPSTSQNAKRSKKSSLKNLVKKTVDILKKPFSKAKRKNSEEEKQKKTKDEIQPKPKQIRKKESISIDYDEKDLNQLEAEKQLKKKKHKISADEDKNDFQSENESNGDDDSSSSSSMQQINSEVNGFFYTNDKFITRFEDQDILEYLKKFYPVFMRDPLDFQTQKKQILDMLQNAQFMEDLLSYYDIDIYEFFKFLFRIEPDLFRGSFLKRIQKALRYKKYAIKAKKCSHIERRRARLKSLKNQK